MIDEKGGGTAKCDFGEGVAWIPSFAFPSLSCGSKSISWALWQASYSVDIPSVMIQRKLLGVTMPWKQILEVVRMSLADSQGSLTGFAYMLMHFFVPCVLKRNFRSGKMTRLVICVKALSSMPRTHDLRKKKKSGHDSSCLSLVLER